MNILRGLFSAVLLAAGVAMVGPAAPAGANPQQQVLEGVYTFKQEGLPDAAWSIYPVCVPVVGDLRAEIRDPVACQLSISSTPNSTAKGGIAKLVGGQWSYNINSVDGLTCPDGSTQPLFETFAFNTITMTGMRTVSHNPGCGLSATLDKFPFTLTYARPLPIPITQYPLICEPGGLRRCF